MAFLSLSEAKVFLGFGDTTWDAKITVWLPVVESYILDYCQNDFKVATVVTYPNALKMIAARLIGYLLQSPAYPQPFRRGDVQVLDDVVFDKFRADLAQWKKAKFI